MTLSAAWIRLAILCDIYLDWRKYVNHLTSPDSRGRDRRRASLSRGAGGCDRA